MGNARAFHWGMNKIELIGELFLVRERRSLHRDDRADRLLIASEIVAMFERQGREFALPTRGYHVGLLSKSVPFVRFICGSAVFEQDLLGAADMPVGHV